MLKSATRKLMWLGRATSALVGLAILLALAVGAGSRALAHTNVDTKLFHLGHNNPVGAMSTLTGTLAGAVLKADNNGAGPALSLEVSSGKAPLVANAAAGTATGLSSDELDGRDSSAYQRRVGGSCAEGSSIRVIDSAGATTCEPDDDGATQVDALRRELGTNDARTNEASDPVSFAKVKDVPQDVLSRNADALDGLDSAAFGIATEHAGTPASSCDSPGFSNECAKIQVVVPPGKHYVVSVWSTMSIRGGATEHDVLYCAAQNKKCITPSGHMSRVRTRAGQTVTAASEGETAPLPEGTYTFSTVIQTSSEFSTTVDSTDPVVTKVMVRDASAPQPTGVSRVP